MTTAEPEWGDDLTLIDRYALRLAAAVARVFLPLNVVDTDQWSTWRAALEDYRTPEPLDGYTSWNGIAEIPGDGSWAPRHRYARASGIVAPTFSDVLLRVLERDPAARIPWTFRPASPAGGSATMLRPPGLSRGTGAVPADDFPVGGATDAAQIGQSSDGGLRSLAAIWARAGFSGRAWRADGRLALAAPRYADSIIISGPADVIAAVTGSPELEAFPVARSSPLPDMAD